MQPIDKLLEEIQNYLWEEQQEMMKTLNGDINKQPFLTGRFFGFYDASENIGDMINRYRKSLSQQP